MMPSKLLLWGSVALVVLVAYTANSIVVGFSQVFRTILLSKIVIAACGIAIAFVILYANFLYAARQLGDPRRYVNPQVMASPLGSVISERTVGWLAAIASLVLAVLTGITVSPSVSRMPSSPETRGSMSSRCPSTTWCGPFSGRPASSR
jgi:hypothetical protein